MAPTWIGHRTEPLVILPPDYLEVVTRALNDIFSRLGGGGGGHLPGPDNRRGSDVMLFILGWTFVTLLIAAYQDRLLFAGQVIALMAILSSVPIISSQIFPQRPLRAIFETIIVTIAVAAFVWGKFGGSLAAGSVWRTALALLVLEAGGHFIEWYKEDSIKRLNQWPDVFAPVSQDTTWMNSMFRRQQLTYLAIPLGFLAGLNAGLALSYPDEVTVTACLVAILCLASLFLAYFLIQSGKRMCDHLFTPAAGAVAVAQDRDLELADAVTNLRKIYLFDSLHNVLLMGLFTAIVASLFTVSLTPGRMAAGLLIATFAFCQLPFTIGQLLLHRAIMYPRRASNSVEFRKKLSEIAPLFPAFQLLSSLGTTGAGYFLFSVLGDTIKGTLKF